MSTPQSPSRQSNVDIPDVGKVIGVKGGSESQGLDKAPHYSEAQLLAEIAFQLRKINAFLDKLRIPAWLLR
jgi:hypothetical protein